MKQVCSEVMTTTPYCCLPTDTVEKAVEIMKTKDAGAIPIVNNFSERKIVGMVTDRDIALQAIPEKDPANLPLERVMTPNPLTCKPSDSLGSALKTMAKAQVRRLPVVDDAGRLMGIVAQSDIALEADPEKTGEMVREISQPGDNSRPAAH